MTGKRYYVGENRILTFTVGEALRVAVGMLDKKNLWTRVAIYHNNIFDFTPPMYVYILPDKEGVPRYVYFTHIPGKGRALGVDCLPVEGWEWELRT